MEEKRTRKYRKEYLDLSKKKRQYRINKSQGQRKAEDERRGEANSKDRSLSIRFPYLLAMFED